MTPTTGPAHRPRNPPRRTRRPASPAVSRARRELDGASLEHSAARARHHADALAARAPEMVRRPGSANLATLLGLLLAIAGGTLLACNLPLFAALAIAASGLADLVDGALARAYGSLASGALYDTMADRLGEIVIFAGFLPAASGLGLYALFAALSGSLMVSYASAFQRSLGHRVPLGIAPRGVRVVLVIVACAPMLRTPTLLLIAVLAAITVATRMVLAGPPGATSVPDAD